MGDRRRRDRLLPVAGRARHERAALRLRAAAERRAGAQADPARLPPVYAALTGFSKLDSAGVTGYKARPFLTRRDRRRQRPLHAHQRPREPDEQPDHGPDRRESQRVHVVAQPLHRRRRDQRRARARARAGPLVVADRADPAHRGATRRDRRRRLLRTARRAEPRRARLARREREPDERRAAAPLRRARDGEPAQERVPREHVARAAHAAERDHRLLAGAAAAAVRRGQREAGGVPRRHPLVGQPPALADQRRARPVEGRGRAGRARGRDVLAARGARARRRDGARAGDARTASSSRSSSRPDVDIVRGDERRVRQVVFNLLSNAVKFTPAGGSVAVATARVDGEVQVSVADTGPGHRARGPGADLRGVPADRRRRRAARGHRPRPRALEAPRRAARRPDLGRERARPRQPLRLHAARSRRRERWPASRSSSSRTTRRT